MTKIDGGICAAKGFKASGTYCGIKKPAVENPNPDYVHKTIFAWWPVMCCATPQRYIPKTK